MFSFTAFLKDRRPKYIGKGILVGIGTGIIVSLFRLGVEWLFTRIQHLYYFFQEQPVMMIAWIFVSLIVAVILGKLVHSDPDS